MRQASSDPACSDESIKRVLDLRFGEKRAAFDPNDPEANKRWVAEGGTLVYGPMLSGEEWGNAKRAGTIQSAGQLRPTPRPYGDDRDGKPVTVISPEKWTQGMRAIADYAVLLGQELMGVAVRVRFVHSTGNFAACYAPGKLDFNVFRLGHKFFEQGITQEVDALLLHELSHHFSGDHLSEEYHEGICLLGAKLKWLALEHPDKVGRKP